MNQLIDTIKKQSPLILSCIAAAGTVVTAVFSARAAPKATQRIREAQCSKGRILTTSEKVKAAAPVYLPTAGVGAVTILCIFGSNALNKHQQASLMSAYAMLDRIHKEYKEQVIERYGEDADKQIRQEIIKEKYADSDIPPWCEKQIFYEEHYGKFFELSKEQVLEAEYHFNRNFALRGYANLNEFFEFLGLPKVEGGDSIGWSIEAGEVFYGYSWVDFEHHCRTMDDGMTYCEIAMPFPPTADYMESFD